MAIELDFYLLFCVVLRNNPLMTLFCFICGFNLTTNNLYFTVQVGMTLLSVDRQKVEGFSKDEVLAVIEKCYMDKHHVSMKLVLHKDESTDF